MTFSESTARAEQAEGTGFQPDSDYGINNHGPIRPANVVDAGTFLSANQSERSNAPAAVNVSETVDTLNIDLIADDLGQSADQGDAWLVAGGEIFQTDDIHLPSSDLHASDAEASVKPSTSPKATPQNYRQRLDLLQACAQRAAASTGDTRKHRNELLVGVATLVLETGFEIKAFCTANGIRRTAATDSNPALAVIRAALPETDRKLASKWGIGLKQALLECGGADKLSEYLKTTTIEECVTAARAAKRRMTPAGFDPTLTRSPVRRLVITNVPPLSDGRGTVTIEITDGRARFISHVQATDMSANSVARPNAGDADEQPTEIAFGEMGEDTSTHSCLVAPEIRPDGPDAAGDKPVAEEVPAAA